MTKELIVYKKTNYGTDFVYPNCKFSKMITDISGHKTLTEFTINKLKQHGYTFKVVAENQEV
tara:strand:+ start:1603 stop:1788 length:186 start_codon:yes stop_codon:yes gene_type:complete